MTSVNTLVIALIVLGITMLGLKLLFPNKSMNWYMNRAKIVISIGFLILIIYELLKMKA
ncbi:MAG: hypothetical protein MJ081_00415 [Ruminococcus sp.]|nr:hypothetical protein [Ruminococcus sp.]